MIINNFYDIETKKYINNSNNSWILIKITNWQKYRQHFLHNFLLAQKILQLLYIISSLSSISLARKILTSFILFFSPKRTNLSRDKRPDISYKSSLFLISYKIVSIKLYFVSKLRSCGCSMIRLIKLIKTQQIFFLTSA